MLEFFYLNTCFDDELRYQYIWLLFLYLNHLCVFCVLLSSGDSMSTVECYDPITNIWNSAEDMKTVRSRVGVAVLNGKQ